MVRQEPEIYFHLGFGRTEASYLRRTFFPRLQGVRFVHPGEYTKLPKIVGREMVHKFFVSNSMDIGLEDQVKKFARKFPQTQTILTFRRHDKWLYDLYVYLVNMGLGMSFKEFYDAETNQGYLKHVDCDYMSKIKFLESVFDQKPLVLFLEDLDRYPYEFFDAFAQIMFASYRKFDIELQEKVNAKNPKKKENKIEIKSMANAKIFGREGVPLMQSGLNLNLGHRLKLAVASGLGLGMRMLPSKMILNGGMVDDKDLERIRIRHAQDWIAVHEYAKTNNYKNIRGAINPSVLRLGRY